MLTSEEGKVKVLEGLECAALSTGVSLFELCVQTHTVIILCAMRFTYHSTTEVRGLKSTNLCAINMKYSHQDVY